MDLIEKKQEEEREIPPEELRRVMYRDLVSNHIVSEKDLKAQVEEEVPALDNFAKATSYMLENHKSLFELFRKSDAYYEAVKLARRLVEDGIIVQHDEQFHCSPYYFDKDDTKTMNAIDLQLIKYFPKAIIPTEHPFIRKERIKFESKPKPVLEDKVEKSEELKIESEFVTVSAHLRKNYARLFNGLDPAYISTRASKITGCLANEGVVSKQEKKYNNSFYYFGKDDTKTMNSIDDAINKIYTEGLKEPKQERIKVNPELISVSGYIRNKHGYLFNNVDEKSELDKANHITTKLAKAGVVSRKDKKFINTYLYFSRDDKDTMKAIDDEINRLYTKEGKRRPNERKPRPEPEFITVSKYLIQNHPELFANLTTSGSTFAKANFIAEILAEEGVISKQEEKYHNTTLYFRRKAIDAMNRIDYAISNGVVEKKRVNAY